MTYGALFCEQRILHAAISATVVYFVYGTLEPILALRLLDYDLEYVATGVVFGIFPLTYLIGTLLFTCDIPKWIARRVMIITSLFILSVATCFVGPFLKNRIWFQW